jgi:hypothetical protein
MEQDQPIRIPIHRAQVRTRKIQDSKLSHEYFYQGPFHIGEPCALKQLPEIKIRLDPLFEVKPRRPSPSSRPLIHREITNILWTATVDTQTIKIVEHQRKCHSSYTRLTALVVSKKQDNKKWCIAEDDIWSKFVGKGFKDVKIECIDPVLTIRRQVLADKGDKTTEIYENRIEPLVLKAVQDLHICSVDCLRVGPESEHEKDLPTAMSVYVDNETKCYACRKAERIIRGALKEGLGDVELKLAEAALWDPLTDEDRK